MKLGAAKENKNEQNKQIVMVTFVEILNFWFYYGGTFYSLLLTNEYLARPHSLPSWTVPALVVLRVFEGSARLALLLPLDTACVTVRNKIGLIILICPARTDPVASHILKYNGTW